MTSEFINIYFFIQIFTCYCHHFSVRLILELELFNYYYYHCLVGKGCAFNEVNIQREREQSGFCLF